MTVHNREQGRAAGADHPANGRQIGIKPELDVVERVAWGEKVRIQKDCQMASRQSA